MLALVLMAQVAKSCRAHLAGPSLGEEEEGRKGENHLEMD
jgi:hypothetical protein